jgi:hypothetical protein
MRMTLCSHLRSTGRHFVSLLLIAPLFLHPAWAQQVSGGQTATSSAGQVGRRETREEAATKINPLAAVDGRVQNRIQSRLRTRIDRDYTPQSNTLLPFLIAGEVARTPRRSTRR